jgi:AcrR family transcriptional regulator
MSLATTLMEQRKQGAIDAIARTALELFLRDGFDASSVDTIAAAAGCSPRTFYRYFGTKEDVMFHDLPVAMEELREDLDAHLAEGLSSWEAVSRTFETMISRWDATDQGLLAERMNLWMTEPALRARYMQFVSQSEDVVADCLHRHRGTTPEHDNLPDLIAVAAIGAYRVTLVTHQPPRQGRKLQLHLREALNTLGAGLAGEAAAAPAPRKRAARKAAGAKAASATSR